MRNYKAKKSRASISELDGVHLRSAPQTVVDATSAGTEPCYVCMQKGVPRFHAVVSPVQKKRRRWMFGAVIDPRIRPIQRLNRLFLLARLVSLALDPLFFYALAVREEMACLYVDGTFAFVVTVLRSVVDGLHLLHIWLQLKVAYVSKGSATCIVSHSNLVWNGRQIALHYLRPGGGFMFDVFVILPLPQVVLWVVVPRMMLNFGDEANSSVMTLLLIVFLLQFIPKVVHLVFLARRMRRATGFIFGTAWWGFTLNLMAYILASHVTGACWYLLATQRVVSCLVDQCRQTPPCDSKFVGCSPPVLVHGDKVSMLRMASASHDAITSACFNADDGIYGWALPLVTGATSPTKIFFLIFWGLMNLSTFGNALQPSAHFMESVFCIIVVICGLLLFSWLIGNIQVFLHSITEKKETMKLRLRELEHWMRRRQLPLSLRQRVRRYERHHWAATRGINEEDMIGSLPEGLRRDIKQHLALDLIRQVPLFEHMDDLVLENVCQRLKPYLFIEDEVVIREGDPVKRMLFVVRGHLLSSHSLSNGHSSVCFLGPGNFCGDELLAWCLRKPFVDRLIPSFATLTSLDPITEAFGLDAEDLKFVTEHFRYNFINEKLKRKARYYSSGWRTWAVVTIQLSWRRFKAKKLRRISTAALASMPADDLEMSGLPRSGSTCDRLRFYAAMFSSHKPQDPLE